MNDQPFRPTSAYMLWLNSVREQIKADNPGLKITEIAKKGGELWRAMKDKSEWEEKATKAMKQYNKEYQNKSFEANGGGDAREAHRARRGSRAKGSSAANKRPLSTSLLQVKELNFISEPQEDQSSPKKMEKSVQESEGNANKRPLTTSLLQRQAWNLLVGQPEDQAIPKKMEKAMETKALKMCAEETEENANTLPLSTNLLQGEQWKLVLGPPEDQSSPTKIEITACEKCVDETEEKDKRNEIFAQLLSEELKHVKPCLRTIIYIKILKFINSSKNLHFNEIEDDTQV